MGCGLRLCSIVGTGSVIATSCSFINSDAGRIRNFTPQVASRNLPTFKAQAGKVVNVNHMNATSSQRFQKNARISGTNNQKPGTSYAVNKGVYNLVSGIALGQDGNGQAVYAEGGVLAYIDRPLTFHNTTPLCDEFSWAFGGSTYTEDSLSMRPYFPNNGFYFDTPVLTATLGSADSTYQLGAHIDATTHKKCPEWWLHL